jgi:hypothetical protein
MAVASTFGDAIVAYRLARLAGAGIVEAREVESAGRERVGFRLVSSSAEALDRGFDSAALQKIPDVRVGGAIAYRRRGRDILAVDAETGRVVRLAAD